MLKLLTISLLLIQIISCEWKPKSLPDTLTPYMNETRYTTLNQMLNITTENEVQEATKASIKKVYKSLAGSEKKNVTRDSLERYFNSMVKLQPNQTSLIDQMSSFALMSIGQTDTPQKVTFDQVDHYYKQALNTSIDIYPFICKTVDQRLQTCLDFDNSIQRKVELMNYACERGYTRIGGYSIEECILSKNQTSCPDIMQCLDTSSSFFSFFNNKQDIHYLPNSPLELQNTLLMFGFLTEFLQQIDSHFFNLKIGSEIGAQVALLLGLSVFCPVCIAGESLMVLTASFYGQIGFLFGSQKVFDSLLNRNETEFSNQLGLDKVLE